MNEEFEDFEKNDTIFCTLCRENIPIDEWTQHLDEKHTENTRERARAMTFTINEDAKFDSLKKEDVIKQLTEENQK